MKNDGQEQNATCVRWWLSTMTSFTDRLSDSNDAYVKSFDAHDVPGRAGVHLLLLTCMDSRIVPHAVLGLEVGDMKVIRNAGAQLNPEVERDIVLGSYLLDCDNIVIMAHTRCAMASLSVTDVKETLEGLSGLDFSTFEPRMIENQEEKLRGDVATLLANPLLKNDVKVRGAIYDVDTGKVNWIC